MSTTQVTQWPDGVHNVMVTPFNSDETVSYEDLDKFLNNMLESNVAGIVTLGTTTETPVLSFDEKKQMVEYMSSRVKGKKFLTVGVGGNNTKQVAEFVKLCQPYVDGFMVTVPHYNKPEQRGIVAHFKYIDDVVNCPCIMYNVPSRAGVNMLPETVIDVLKCTTHYVAIKEASGDLDQIKKLINLVKENSFDSRFKVFSGNDSDMMEVVKMGGRGVISVASNVFPNSLVEVTNMCLNGRFDEAKHYNNVLTRFTKAMFVESNPVPIKFLLHQTGFYSSDRVRLPLVELEENNKKFVAEEYRTMMSVMEKFENTNSSKE
jgi:4-hydroxy-tetrahydrodipicolinate synthase